MIFSNVLKIEKNAFSPTAVPRDVHVAENRYLLVTNPVTFKSGTQALTLPSKSNMIPLKDKKAKQPLFRI